MNKDQRRSIITTEDARRYCKSRMQASNAIQACTQSIPAINTNTDIENCAFDVSVSATSKFVTFALVLVSLTNGIDHTSDCTLLWSYDNILNSLKKEINQH